MTRSTYGFCQGDRGGVRDVRQSHGVDGAVDGGVEGGIPVVQQNRSPACHGNASRTCCCVQADVGLGVTLT